jgi:hypothetical protein
VIKKLAALAGGWLSDPYVCCTLGSLLLLRGLDAIAAQARDVAAQVADVQAQATAAANGQYPYDTIRSVQYGEGKLDPSEVPGPGSTSGAAPEDVAGEHEDLHP